MNKTACVAIRRLITHVMLIVWLGFGLSAVAEEITVAIYPYLLDLEYCQESLARRWAALEPDVPLRFVFYDCYAGDAPTGIDVLMYDAIAQAALVENGFIRPMDQSMVEDADGIFPAALEAAHIDGQLYGVPAFLCTNGLIYRRDDHALDDAQNIVRLYEIIGDRITNDEKPLNSTDGLFLNLLDCAPYIYQEAIIDRTGYSAMIEPKLSPPDLQSISVLRMLSEMSGLTMSVDDDPDVSLMLEWFLEGYGRAYYGYTESLAGLNEIIDQLSVHPLAFDEENDVQLFYMDIVSLCASVQSAEKTALCMKLVNLLTSEAVLTQWCLGQDYPQYLLPARPALYDRLAAQVPIYREFIELVEAEPMYIAYCGADVFDYIHNADENLPEMINAAE